MTVRIVQVKPWQIAEWLFAQPEIEIGPEDQATFRRCFLTSTELWIGFKDQDLVCVWGLVPPTLLADYAYLWLYTTPHLAGNEFYFVRHSQRAVENMLERYPIIVGHAAVHTEQSLRWLKWLGAVFKEREGKLIPFNIRKKQYG